MLIPIILSGGVGSRLWPLSRKAKPKHFMPLIEDHIDEQQRSLVTKSLLQQTVLRCDVNLPDSPFSTNPVMVCDYDHRFLVLDQCEELNIIPEEIIIEPERKDTAAAILLAAIYIQKKYPDAVLLVLPSDHYMSDYDYFINRINNVYNFAKDNNNIITFGITPTYPETGYGYINFDNNHDLDKSIYKVKRFIEKPKLTVAEKLLEDHDCYWNSGMFMFRASKFLDVCKEFQPELLKYCVDTVDTGYRDHKFLSFNSTSFRKINPISVDYAVMEDTFDMVVAQYDGQWADVGCWHGVWQNSPKDENNNVIMGNVINNENVDNCYLRADSRLIVASDIQNLSIIETPDAILVSNLESSQSLRNIVEASIANNKKEFLEHSHVNRPWGEYLVLSDNHHYKVKQLIVNPGAALSLQSHKHRSEHWIIVKGQAEVIINEEVSYLNANDSIYIPMGAKHRITNNQKTENLIIIEVQTGDYLGEDDIIRYQDNYGRAKNRE